MRIKIRYLSQNGSVRIENVASLKEVMINEDFLHPEHESIALGFKNKESSGIIELTPEELEMVAKSVQKKKHLIKGLKVFGGSGAIRFPEDK